MSDTNTEKTNIGAGEVVQISQLDVENVMRLKAVSLNVEGQNVVIVGGDNGQGKSSLLGSIASLIGGKSQIPEKPVREGQKKASIIAQLSNGLTVKRTFTEAGGTNLVVSSLENGKFNKPQDILDELTTSIAFDPVSFISKKPKDQLETLKTVLGIDFSELDEKRQKLYDERTVVNKELENLRAKVKNTPVNKDVPDAEIAIADVVAELNAAREKNRKKDVLDKSVLNAENAVNLENQNRAHVNTQIKSLEEQIEKLKRDLTGIDTRLGVNEAELKRAQYERDSFVVTDTAALEQKLANVENTNRLVRENLERARIIKEGQSKAAIADKLTSSIEKIDEEKRITLKEAKYPVEGLSFDDSGVLYNGIPFAQASSAQKLRVSVAMAAAMNPKLRVILVKDGSLMDQKSLKLLSDLAKEYNLQVWVERVSKGEECSVIISEGEVVGGELFVPNEAKKDDADNSDDDCGF